VVTLAKVSGRGTIVNSNLRKPSLVIVLLAGFAVGGCGSIQPEIFESSFWSGSPQQENEEAELGLGELAKGNTVAAENHFEKALEANPQDLYALIGAGIMYQNTGQKTKAREMYEAVIALRPTESDRFVIWNTTDTRPVSEIASVNLALMESGGVVAEVQQGVASARGAPGGGNGGFPGGAMANGAPRIGVVDAGVWTNGPPGSNGVSLLGLTDADANVVSRFETMRVLRDQGLVTPDEYAVRRQTNIGALLPLTAPPPAAGLDRPVPGTQEIVGRLRAIGRALEMRALTVSQHGAERSMIVDALMPATPLMTAPPAPPPQGLMEAADSVRKLEQLRDAGYITSDEYAKERAAVERALLPPPPVVPSVATAAPSATASPPARTAIGNEGGVRPAVHLASYRSRKDAERGWTLVRRAYEKLLDGLTAEITEVDLGPDRGLYFRLNAGPLESEAAAVDLCRNLKRRHQYCQPTMLKAG
jgi:tetratricopeptide (TPR) repeat protein